MVLIFVYTNEFYAIIQINTICFLKHYYIKTTKNITQTITVDNPACLIKMYKCNILINIKIIGRSKTYKL